MFLCFFFLLFAFARHSRRHSPNLDYDAALNVDYDSSRWTTETRVSKGREISLNDDRWRFRFDPNDYGVSKGWHAPGAHLSWQRARVPMAFNADTHVWYQGVAWYRRALKLPVQWRAWVQDRVGSVFLHFHGCNLRCEAWLDGIAIGRNRQPYMPFQLDVTDAILSAIMRRYKVELAADARRKAARGDADAQLTVADAAVADGVGVRIDEAGDRIADDVAHGDAADADETADADNTFWLAVRVETRVNDLELPDRRWDGWRNYGGLVREVYLVYKPIVYVRNVNITTEWFPSAAVANGEAAAAAGAATTTKALAAAAAAAGVHADDVAAAHAAAAAAAATDADVRLSGVWRVRARVQLSARATAVRIDRAWLGSVTATISEAPPKWLTTRGDAARTPRLVWRERKADVVGPAVLRAAKVSADVRMDALDTADEARRLPVSEVEFSALLPARDVAPWWPDDEGARAALYRFTVRTSGVNDPPHLDGFNDSYTLRFGFRHLERRGAQLFVNNRRVRLRGVARHEFFPAHGMTIPAGRTLRDLLEWHALNANFLRTGHYTQHPRVYEMADELGLLVWTEIPAWKTELATLNASFEQWLAPQLRAMVRWHAHHPSVIIWSVGNEFRSNTRVGGDYVRRACELVRSLDATRLCSFACNRHFAHQTDYGVPHVDVIALNQYYGWYYGHASNLSGVMERFHAAHPDKPIMISELGAGAVFGRRTPPEQLPPRGKFYSEDYQARHVSAHLEQVWSDQLAPWSLGSVVWIYNDFPDPHRVGDGHPEEANYVCSKGLVTMDRRRKLAFDQVANIYAVAKNK